ncbi:hypothetical protein DOTSEDRAFT_29825 [Dothistroma septosporum NZE10]|uniref:F-box domain-containing protein n=1 Tax=Dothistroma septosporum (strain NZE10 / CBS 128990) TaxID=675120 RepID=N1PXW9_DOTSN|nr:hypothetical protein DOTSEDRAFT_29825 [Dothistroma septosporum NZE10]
MSFNSLDGASQAPTIASRRFSDTSRTATAFERLLVSSDHAEHQQTRTASIQVDPTPLPPPHTCSAAECAITKVFETTELLELVLGFLGTSDVLGLQRINKQWNEIIQESPLLRLHYFVNPQWSRRPQDYQLLDVNMSGFTIASGEPVEMGRWIEVTMTRAAASRICPNGRVRSRALSVHEGLRGLRRARETAIINTQAPELIASQLQHESLYVIQPPIAGLQAFAVDSQPAEAGASSSPSRGAMPRVMAKIHCDTGITLGFLAEAVQKLLRSAGEGDDDMDEILFKAIVSFAPAASKPKKRDGRRSVVRL